MADEKNEQCMLPKSARSCMMAALGNEFCEGCGWNAAEQGEDGKYGKHVGVKPGCQKPQQSAGDT